MVCLLVGGCKAAKDQDVLVGNLIKATAFETDPVGVLLDAQVERLPVLTATDVVLLDQVCPLAAVEAGDDVQGGIVECDCGVEVAASVQTGDLSPRVGSNIINFTLVHGLTGQGAANGINL